MSSAAVSPSWRSGDRQKHSASPVTTDSGPVSEGNVGEIETAARQLFEACTGNGGVLRSHDLHKICQELQLAPLADQLAVELGADSEGGIHFHHFLSWYKTALEDVTAASSRASSSPDTPSSNCEVNGSDDEDAFLDQQLAWGVWPGATDNYVGNLQLTAKKGSPLAAVQSEKTPQQQQEKTSGANEMVRKEVQDLIASIDINTTDLSELATKIHQVTINSLRESVISLQRQVKQSQEERDELEKAFAKLTDERAQLIATYEKQLEATSAEQQRMSDECSQLRRQLAAAEREVVALNTIQTPVQHKGSSSSSLGRSCANCKTLGDKLSTLSAKFERLCSLQVVQLSSSSQSASQSTSSRNSFRSDDATESRASQPEAASIPSPSSSLKNINTKETPDQHGHLQQWLAEQGIQSALSPVSDHVIMQRQAELSQLVGEHFNAGVIDQLDQKLRKCESIDEVIRVVSTHISSHFEGELKYSQLENERLESQMMCQEAESNLLSIALAESKDVADRVALQAAQLQSNMEVLQLLMELGQQDCSVMQLLLESSELKVLQLALKLSQEVCLTDDTASLASLSVLQDNPQINCNDLGSSAGQLHELEGNLLRRVHDLLAQIRPKNAGMHASVSACTSFSLDEHRVVSPGGHMAVSRCQSSNLSCHGWDDVEEASYADSGNHSAFVSQPKHEKLVVDLWRLQHYRTEVKDLQNSLAKSLVPVDVLSAQPSMQSQQRPKSSDESSQLYHQLIAENAVLLQDLGVLVRDKADLKKQLHVLSTERSQLKSQLSTLRSREHSLIVRQQQLQNELSNQMQRKQVLERELDNVRSTLHSTKVHLASSSLGDLSKTHRSSPTRRSSSCRLKAGHKPALIQSHDSSKSHADNSS